jgi:hypothetical protein
MTIIGNYQLALIELNNIKRNELSIADYQLLSHIKQILYDRIGKMYVRSDLKGEIFVNLVHREAMMNKLVYSINSVCENKVGFWNIFKNSEITLENLYQIVQTLNDKKDEVQQNWEILKNEEILNDKQVVSYFAIYNKYICDNKREYDYYIKNYINSSIFTGDSKDLTFLDDYKFFFLVNNNIENKHEIGKIEFISRLFEGEYKFDKREILGKQISVLEPEVIKEFIQDKFVKIIEKCQNLEKLNEKFFVYLIDKKKFLKPYQLIISPMPSNHLNFSKLIIMTKLILSLGFLFLGQFFYIIFSLNYT